MVMHPVDDSAGYEQVAQTFMSIRSSSVGVEVAREWASTLPAGTDILDLGCGHGQPISCALAKVGFNLFGVDASPTLLAAYRKNVNGARTEHAGVLDADFFKRSFDSIMAWGVIFLLPPSHQERLIQKVGQSLNDGGRFLFTAPRQQAQWRDNLTHRTSWSMGSERYIGLLANAGMTLEREFEAEEGNYYYQAVKQGD